MSKKEKQTTPVDEQVKQLEEELKQAKDENLEYQNDKIALENKCAELEQKLDETLFVLGQAENRIKEYEQGVEGDIAEEASEYTPIETINAGDEYVLCGNSDVTAKIEALYPAGQCSAYPVNSAVILINGERCVLSQALIKECFIQKEEIPF